MVISWMISSPHRCCSRFSADPVDELEWVVCPVQLQLVVKGPESSHNKYFSDDGQHDPHPGLIGMFTRAARCQRTKLSVGTAKLTLQNLSAQPECHCASLCHTFRKAILSVDSLLHTVSDTLQISSDMRQAKSLSRARGATRPGSS